MFIDKYGKSWESKPDDLDVEFNMVRLLYFKEPQRLCQHYLNIHKLIWPEDSQHRWFKLGMKCLCENKINVFMGPASSNKTYLFVAHALIDFWIFPHTSLSIISSTDIISLERKVWGRIKKMFNRGRESYPWLDGFVLDSKRQITPDEIDDENEIARSLDHGIGTVACVSGGKFVGMGKFQGAKPPHSPGKNDGILKHYGDEAAVMLPSFLDAYSNWMVNSGFKGVMAGNPTDISDPLCIAGEPVGGWDAWEDSKKTQEWESKWYDAHVVAFDGRDTPNNDEPKNSFPFLITDQFVELMKKTHGEDSWQYYQQAIGKPSHGMVSDRVITVSLCEKNKAFDHVVWRGDDLIRIYALDPAYGGGDRCVGGMLEFGNDFSGRSIIRVGTPEILPVKLSAGMDAEEQIANLVFSRCEGYGIPASNIFFDSFGRGTLSFAFAKLFGSNTPVPVNSGDMATKRPVRFDLFVTDDRDIGKKRLKRCDEHYKKFVTEMWFSTREAIESQQVRDLPKEVAEEGQQRMFRIVSGNRIEVEPKDEMKLRIHKSPDLYDWFAIGVEGARRLGFRIERIGADIKSGTDKFDFLRKKGEEVRAVIENNLLSHV